MATRSVICFVNRDPSKKKVVGSYCHWDGYPEEGGVGHTLYHHYNNQESALAVAEHGYFSSLPVSLKDDCKCDGKGCVHCQVTFALKKKGPCMVYSGDLKSSDDKVKPTYDNIPIVELFEDQELEFESTAQLGLGRDHAKWQGAVVGYDVSGKSGDKYEFVVETACGLSAEEVVKKSFEVMKNKLKDFRKDVERLE